MENIEILWITFGAFIGGVLSGIVGWLTSSEPFYPRKFCATIIISLLAGIGFSISYQVSGDTISWSDILTAVFAGAGGDALVNRIGKASFLNRNNGRR